VGHSGHESARGRGRPRDRGLDDRILEQLLVLLGSHGYVGLTLALCGVAKTMILRRWPSKVAVAAAGVERLALQSVDVPDSGTWPGDLHTLLHPAVATFGRSLDDLVEDDAVVDPRAVAAQRVVVLAWRNKARNSSRSGSRMHDGTAGTSGPQLTERQHLREHDPRACLKRSATPNTACMPIGGRSKTMSLLQADDEGGCAASSMSARTERSWPPWSSSRSSSTARMSVARRRTGPGSAGGAGALKVVRSHRRQ
jgi:AcrR family transcriptional regulator